MQNDPNHRWFLLDDQDADYAATIADLQAVTESHGRTYSNVAGAVANTRVVYAYMTAAELAASSPSLTIGTAAVLDRMDYASCINPNAGPATLRTSPYGRVHPWYGKFRYDPEPMPTTPVDRIVWKWQGLYFGEVLYIKQTATGTGSGNSYANAKAVKDIAAAEGQTPTHDPTTYDIIVLCGTLSRHLGEGAQAGGITSGNAFRFKNGSASARTQILSHPVDGFKIIQHARLGYNTGYGDPADWTDEGGGMWSCSMSSGAITILTDRFAFSNAGGTLRVLDKVASSIACAALADSWFGEEDYSGSNDRVFVRLADGSNPKTTTFIPTTGQGLSLGIRNLKHFDVYGGEFWGNTWTGSGSVGSGNFAWYATKFKYYFPQCFGADAGSVNEGNGDFTYDQPTDRKWIGVEFNTGYVAIYDENVGHNRVPLRTTIRESYFYKLNGVAADSHGVNCFSTADAHSLATQGTSTCLIDNNCFDTCGAMTIMHYLLTNNSEFIIPTGGLENTAAYTDAYPPDKCFASSATKRIFSGRLQDAVTTRNLFINPRVAGAYATTGLPRAIAYQGDNFSLDLAGGQYNGNEIAENWIEGAYIDAAICVKLAHGVEAERAVVRDNVILGATVGVFTLMAVTVFGGATYNTSLSFTGNYVYATATFVFNQHISGEHLLDFDDNIYVDDDAANWRHGGDTHATLPPWQGAAQSGDTHDPNSSTATISVSTDIATITINDTTPVVGQTLTATFADDDADGAGSDIRYEWRSNGRVVGGANSATYIARPQDLGFALEAVAFYSSGGNRKVCVSAATSAIGAGTYARKAVVVAA